MTTPTERRERLDAANVKWTALDNELRERDKQLIAANTENERLRADVNHWREARRMSLECGKLLKEEVDKLRTELATCRNLLVKDIVDYEGWQGEIFKQLQFSLKREGGGNG